MQHERLGAPALEDEVGVLAAVVQVPAAPVLHPTGASMGLEVVGTQLPDMPAASADVGLSGLHAAALNDEGANTTKTNGDDSFRKRLGIAEETFDVTLAGAHLVDVEGHVKVAHEYLVDAGMPVEVKSLTKVAQAIVSKEFKVVDIIPGTYTVTDELVKSGASPSLGLVEDVFMIAMQSDTLFHAAQTLACYTVKRIGSFVKNVSKLLGREPDARGHDDEPRDDEPHLPDVSEVKLTLEIVKGSDAIIRLASVWARLPTEICTLLPGPGIGSQVSQAMAAIHVLNSGSIVPH